MSHSQPSRLLLPHAKRIPNVVQLDWFSPEEIETVSDSGASASSTRPTDWMLSGDFACFVLRTHEISLQKGYFIDAARGDEALARKVVSRPSQRTEASLIHSLQDFASQVFGYHHRLRLRS